MAEQIDLISQNTESTVVAEYERPDKERVNSCAFRADRKCQKKGAKWVK